MALKPSPNQHVPCLARNVAATTAAVLHDAAAPIGAKQLPVGVISDTAGVFDWIDASGTNVTTTLAAGIFTPISPAEIRATSAVAVTVFWERNSR